jgi:hypothetical protein
MRPDAFLTSDALLGVAIGLGLAAAAGFRVFVPLLVAAIAAKSGVLELSPGFAWLATTPAIAALAIATLLEVGAYAMPWIDQLLDLIATPAALVAGMLAAASVVVDLPPLVKWSVVLIAGGAAGITQGASVLTRFKSTTLTGGVGNPVVSTMELIGAVIASVLAIFLPLVALLSVVMLLVMVTRKVGRIAFGRRAAHAIAPPTASPGSGPPGSGPPGSGPPGSGPPRIPRGR